MGSKLSMVCVSFKKEGVVHGVDGVECLGSVHIFFRGLEVYIRGRWR